MRSRIGCVVLAAGESRRYGKDENKLLLTFAGASIVQHAIDTASISQAMSCTLVLGAEADRVLAAVDPRRCSVVRNWGWREGIASSLRAGLDRHLDDEACIFMVADQPYVGPGDVNRLISRHLDERDAIVALQAGDVWGTPVLFPRADFPKLERLRGDEGAKPLAQSQGSRLRFVAAISAAAFADVDTRADYERVLQMDPRT